jgi:hypothetical protein
MRGVERERQIDRDREKKRKKHWQSVGYVFFPN